VLKFITLATSYLEQEQAEEQGGKEMRSDSFKVYEIIQMLKNMSGKSTERQKKGVLSHLATLSLESFNNISISGLRETTALSPGLIVGVPLAQSFRAVVERVSKRFMDTLESILAGHEHLCIVLAGLLL